MPRPNPITERLERLYDQYIGFVDEGEARVLRWVIEPDEARMVETFVAVENSEGGELPDLFVRLVTPFEEPHLFALELRAALLQQYAESREQVDLGEWQPPPPSAAEDAIPSLIATCKSLLEHARKQFAVEHLTLVLLPPTVSDAAEWSVWLRRAAHAIDVPDIRFIVLDLKQLAALDPLAEAEPKVIHTEVADLDMPGAYLQVSARAGGLDEPHGAFRHKYVEVVNAIGAGDLDTAKIHAAQAIKIATAQRWWHLVVAVNFCLGSGYLSRKDPVQAIRWFRLADQTAAAAEQSEDYGEDGKASAPEDEDAPTSGDTAKSLRVKARLGMGAAAYSAGAWDEAAKIYAETAPMADELDDLRSVLDCQRMAGHCREKAGAMQPAWDHGMEALGTGRRMDEETRKTSTLAYAGEALLALTKRSRFQAYRKAVEHEMKSLLGPDWRPRHGTAADA